MGLLAVGLIWLVRSLLHYASPVAALLDGLLSVLSVGCAAQVWLLTGNVFLTVWSFFLPQALCTFMPRRLQGVGAGQASRRQAAKPQRQADNFARAHHAAERAIRGLAQS